MPLENHKEIPEELGSRRTAARMEDDWRQQRLSQKSKREQEQQRKAMLEDEAFRKDQQQLQRQLFRSCPSRPRVTPRGGTSFSWFRWRWMGGRSCAGTAEPTGEAGLVTQLLGLASAPGGDHRGLTAWISRRGQSVSRLLAGRSLCKLAQAPNLFFPARI